MSTIKTNYGVLQGVTEFETFCRGKIESCTFEEINKITTPYGILIPQYDDSSVNQRHKNFRSGMTFYDNGQLKSVGFQEATLIKTTAGDIKAEYVTFYKEGALKEIYPLYGKINKDWTEDEEKSLIEPLILDFDFGKIEAHIFTLIFYPGGDLKNIVLWSEDKVLIHGPNQKIEIRHGFSLYENGKIRSLEPNVPTAVETPIGVIMAYDPEAFDGNGNEHSLGYGKSGELISLTTNQSGVEIITSENEMIKIEPQQEILNDERSKSTLTIQFDEARVLIEASNEQEPYIYNRQECQFRCYVIE